MPSQPAKASYASSGRQKLLVGEIDATLTLPGVVVPAAEFGRSVGTMNYIAFVLGRASTVATVVGFSLLLLLTAVVCGAAVFMLHS
jgi:hypothetical protein